jgi:hypothetical protein
MEVHHHPKLENTAHGGTGKRFKEYFLEFVMIFLAVTIGFFAENLREHLSDSNKEKEYIKSLVQDLKIDQQVLSQSTSTLQSGIDMMDSLVIILNNPLQISENTAELYYLARLSPRLQPLLINDKTFEQLQNSGNFRLIKNIGTSNKIVEYYKQLTLVRLLETINENEFTQYKDVASKIFDPEIFIKTEGKGNEIIKLSYNPPLRTNDKDLLQQDQFLPCTCMAQKRGCLMLMKKYKNRAPT